MKNNRLKMVPKLDGYKMETLVENGTQTRDRWMVPPKIVNPQVSSFLENMVPKPKPLGVLYSGFRVDGTSTQRCLLYGGPCITHRT